MSMTEWEPERPDERGQDEAVDADTGEEAEPEATSAGETGADEPRGAGLEIHPLTPDELEIRLETIEAEKERLQDQLLRAQAELVNYRRRVRKERVELTTVAQAELLAKLLPVIDDFERAAESKGESAEAYQEGMKLILRSVQSLLSSLGVERVEPSGEPFDPRYHEAIGRHETDEVPDGHVVEVYQAGYKLRDKLIRAAVVVVAQGGSVAGAEGSAGEEEPSETDDETAADEQGSEASDG